jgi:hypothetical protein
LYVARGLGGVFKIEVRVRDVVEAPAGLALQAAAQESQEPRRRRGGQRFPIGLASEHGEQGRRTRFRPGAGQRDGSQVLRP